MRGHLVSCQEDEQKVELSEEQKVQQAQEISQTHILSQDDFKKLKAIQLKKQTNFAKGRGVKRKKSDTFIPESDTVKGPE